MIKTQIFFSSKWAFTAALTTWLLSVAILACKTKQNKTKHTKKTNPSEYHFISQTDHNYNNQHSLIGFPPTMVWVSVTNMRKCMSMFSGNCTELIKLILPTGFFNFQQHKEQLEMVKSKFIWWYIWVVIDATIIIILIVKGCQLDWC